MKVLCFNNAVDGLPKEVHIVPIGEYKERGFRITKEDCEDIVRNFESFGIKLVIDYEHQSLNTTYNGQPSPAAGWIGKLELREKGVFAVDIEWTEEASELIKSKKYGYISPVIIFDDRDPHDDTWIGCSLHSVALTNTPYFRSDLEPIINSRYANNKPANAGTNKETNMSLEEQIAALKAEVQSKDAKIAELSTLVAAKDGILAENETQKMVDDAITAKKVLPAHRDTALHMARQGKDTFDKFLAATAVVDITKTLPIDEARDEGSDPKKVYAELLRNPVKAEQMKKDNPEKFNALRNAAMYGGTQ